MELYLSLGSNLGYRRANIMQALGLLDEALGVPYSRLSTIDESQSWGFDGPAFLDCVVCYDLPETSTDGGSNGTMVPSIDPITLLELCKSIEYRMGRRETLEFDADGGRVYHDRIIDIDILIYGKLEMDTPQLTVPHKLISKRDFIKNPLREVVSEEIALHFKDILE